MRNRFGNILGKSFLHLILIVVAFLTIFPFYWVLCLGTYSSNDIYKSMPVFPGTFLMNNAATLFSGTFALAYLNSSIVAVGATILTVFFSSLTGYSFAKFRFKGEKVLFWMVMATMMIPMQIGLIAFIMEIRFMGMSDTLLPLILPSVANAYAVFWMRQYIKSAFPAEIIESARIDGCGHFLIFLKLAIPVVKPGMFSIALITFVGSWNSFILPSIVLTKPKLYTLPLAIANLRGMFMVDYGAQFLGISLGVLPIIIVFITSSNSFISGLTAGAVKE